MLHGEVPGLRIGNCVVTRNGEIVCDRLTGLSEVSETILQSQRKIGTRVDLGCAGKRRLPRESGRNGAVCRGVIEDAVATAEHKPALLPGTPREPEPRSEVVLVRVHKSAGKSAGVRPGLVWSDHGDRGEVRSNVEVCQPAIFLVIGRVVLVAQSQIQREIGSYSPLVLSERGVYVGPEISGLLAITNGTGLGQTQKKIGKIEPCAGYGLPAGI